MLGVDVDISDRRSLWGGYDGVQSEQRINLDKWERLFRDFRGCYHFLFRATDVAGNVEAPRSIGVWIAPPPHPCGTT